MLIEKNIPIPPSASDIVNRMEAGDSVLFETEQEALRFRDHMRYRNIRYTTRKLREGYRVWRLA